MLPAQCLCLCKDISEVQTVNDTIACMRKLYGRGQRISVRWRADRPAGRSCSAAPQPLQSRQADHRQGPSAHTAPDQAGSLASLSDTRSVPASLQLGAAPWGVRSGVSASAASLAPGVSKLKLSGAAVSLAASWWGLGV